MTDFSHAYLTGQSPEMKGLLTALGIESNGVAAVRLIVEPDSMVRLEIERYVSNDQALNLTSWILKQKIKAEQCI